MNSPPEDAPSLLFPRIHIRGPTHAPERVAVAREEPLEIQIGGIPMVVIMRTPGHDEDLALGFLWGEGWVTSPDQVISIRHCTTPRSPEAEDNVILVHLHPDTPFHFEQLRRNIYTTSSCGVCGKGSIQNLCQRGPRVVSEIRVPRDVLAELPTKLRRAQGLFAATGGVHGIGLFTVEGELIICREDVGRHNAVDKVIGWALRQGLLPGSPLILLVSGRVSFEIIQKALMAQIPIVAAISAPTSLAIELAEQSGITLVAFLRGETMAVYTHTWRVLPEEMDLPPLERQDTRG